MERFIGLIGIGVLLGIALLMSNNRKAIPFRLVIWGMGLQILFALLILKTPFGKPFFDIIDVGARKLLSFSDIGSDFLFKSFLSNQVEAPLLNFAFRVLPVIIFLSALMAVFYHLGIMQFLIKWIAKIMQKTMKTSGAETLCVSANIFVGQTEAPLLVKPYIQTMTHSEIMSVMIGGFATVAGSVLAIYVRMLSDIPSIAGHLMAASIMSAPAALVVAKIIYPETEKAQTAGELKVAVDDPDDNIIEALSRGAADGLKLAANVAAMLLAFVAVIALINFLLNALIGWSIQDILGLLFKPLAWAMGAPWNEAGLLGRLMGEKIVLTELLAYTDLSEIRLAHGLSDRTAIIASYALCGFANFASIGIQIGGIGGMAPNRKKDIAKLGLKAMVGGALASWLTATIAGLLI